MTLRRVPEDSIKRVTLECECGATVQIEIGARVTCTCRREYYCDSSLSIWENVLRTTWIPQPAAPQFS